MHCLETNEFPYYPTDDVWRREEFSKFIQYQGNLWDNKIIKQTMHGLALSWSYMPHAFDVKCGNKHTICIKCFETILNSNNSSCPFCRESI